MDEIEGVSPRKIEGFEREEALEKKENTAEIRKIESIVPEMLEASNSTEGPQLEHHFNKSTPSEETERTEACATPVLHKSLSISKELANLLRYIRSKKAQGDLNYQDDFKDITSIEEFEAKGFPVHFAVLDGNYNLVHLLAKAGANLNRPDPNGQVPLDLAFEQDDWKMVAALENYDIDWNIKKEGSDQTLLEFFASVCEKKDIDWLEDIITGTMSKNPQKTFGTIHAVFDNHFLSSKQEGRELITRLVEKIVAYGVDVDTPDSQGQSLLYKAVSRLHCYLVQDLKNLEADPNFEVAESSDTPLKLVSKMLEEIEAQQNQFSLMASSQLLKKNKAICHKIIKILSS